MTYGYCNKCGKEHTLSLDPEKLVGWYLRCNCGGFVLVENRREGIECSPNQNDCLKEP